jgi:hypothetical protein
MLKNWPIRFFLLIFWFPGMLPLRAQTGHPARTTEVESGPRALVRWEHAVDDLQLACKNHETVAIIAGQERVFGHLRTLVDAVEAGTPFAGLPEMRAILDALSTLSLDVNKPETNDRVFRLLRNFTELLKIHPAYKN